jgi:hypothetical protein
VDLLDQRAARSGGAVRRRALAALEPHSAPGRHRLVGMCRADRGRSAASHRRRAGPGVGLGLAGRVDLLCRRRDRTGLVLLGSGPDGRRRLDPVPAVPKRPVRSR